MDRVFIPKKEKSARISMKSTGDLATANNFTWKVLGHSGDGWQDKMERVKD